METEIKTKSVEPKPEWQRKDEEWTRRWNFAFGPKSITVDKSVITSETASPVSENNVQIKPETQSFIPLTRFGTRTEERIRGLEDAGRKTEEEKKPSMEPKADGASEEKFNSRYQDEFKKETEANEAKEKQKLALRVKEILSAVHNGREYEKKWFNKGLEAEEKARENTSKVLAETKDNAEKQIAMREIELRRKIQEIRNSQAQAIEIARKLAEEKGKEELWEKIHKPIKLKEKIKIMFKRYPKNPETYEQKAEKELRKKYWTNVAFVGGGVAATVGTWATMQHFGYFLPFDVPIKEVIVNIISGS